MASMILPPNSVDFRYSGRPYYERMPSKKVDKLRSTMPEDFFLHMESTSVDCSVYEGFKGTSISVESVDLSFDASDYA